MITLDILYQDEYLVAIDKPPGMLVHPGKIREHGDLVAMKILRDELGRRVFPLHRLDRPTSGVLLFALDRKSAGIVQQAFASRNIGKRYHAIVTGEPPDCWSCETPLANDPAQLPLPAETIFRRLATTRMPDPGESCPLPISLIEATPVTGRFHQIRRHLLETGHPIAGDFRYAGMDRSFELGKLLGTGTRMLLQAKTLELGHPVSGRALRITAPVPPEFRSIFPGID